jgi:6-phosphogluconolactonase (cycloisomerase 2 family)
MVKRASLVLAALAAFSFPASASAIPGDLTYQGCITGELESGPDGTGACTAIPAVVANGVESGLDKLESVAVSPEGRSVYVAAGAEDDAVAHFNRDPATGALSYVGCISGDNTIVDCTPIPDATVNGWDTGMNSPESIAVSADGRSVYATSRFDDAIAQFSRDPATGALTYIGCDSSEDETGGIILSACDVIGSPTASGIDSGFDDPKIKAPVISADGRFVYAAGAEDDSVVVFDRNTDSGELSFDSCITGEIQSSGPCTDIPGASSQGDNSGLDDPRWLVMGPDDVTLYAVASRDNAIARLSRNPVTGALDFEDCITGDSTGPGSAGSGVCSEVPSATPVGNDSGFANPRAMAISADGESAYAIGANDAAILSFDRNPATGTLTYLGCVTGEESSGSAGTGACALLPTATALGDNSGFNGMRSMGISPDGVSLYTSAQFDDALATFDRDSSTGALTFDRCVTGDTDVACAALPFANPGGEDSGFDELETIALSSDGRSLYGASEFDDAVSRFDREPVPQPTGDCQGATVPKTDGTAGDDTLTGTASGDLISGLAGNDTLDALAGNDCLFGDEGGDAAKGGPGKDRVAGASGRDRLRGNGGKDRVSGAGGKDRLIGGGGKDRLKGGPGKDTIKPGGGKDRVNCGGGRDKVVAAKADRISDNCERVKVKS